MSQVVVVTGASAGVGRACAVAFARRGDRVALLARGEAGLQGAARDVEAAGGRALPVPVDVSDPAAVEAAAARVEAELGPVDVWVNVAMAAVLAEVGQTEPEEFRRVIEVTLLGSVYGTMAALRRMGPRRRGTIVQVGSALAHRGIPLQASYCAAKHGLQGFFESLRVELLHQESPVRYVMVHLPGLNTPQFTWVRVRGLTRRPRPVAPVYQPEVAARAVVWAAEHGGREVLVGGSTVGTVLGNRLAPWLADRILARTNYEAQQTDQPLEPERSDYLFGALDDDVDRGAHGPFDDEASDRSTQLWLRTHRSALWALAGAGALAAAGGALRARGA